MMELVRGAIAALVLVAEPGPGPAVPPPPAAAAPRQAPAVAGPVVVQGTDPAPRAPGHEPTRGVFDITRFGAIADDQGVDDEAFQAALDAAGRLGGGLVLVPCGTFLTAPSGPKGSLRVPANTTVAGQGPCSVVKVKDDAGDYMRIFTAAGHGAENVVFRDFRVDQNPCHAEGTPGQVGNCTCDIRVGDASRRQEVISGVFPDLVVEGMRFDPATGISTVVPGGKITRGATVARNLFRFAKGRSEKGTYDNSAIYMRALSWTVSDNRFERAGGARYAETLPKDARTAIETHGGPGLVSGNIVMGYMAGTHVVTLLAGEATAVPQLGVTVTGNVYTDVNIGVDVWAATGTVAAGVVIANNVISLGNAGYGYRTHVGIGVKNQADGALSGDVENLTIANNVVTMQREERADVDAANSGGIRLYSRNPMRGVSVTGNTVRDAPTQCFRLHSLAPEGVDGVVVEGNLFADCGGNKLAGVRSGMVLAGRVRNARVRGNTVLETRADASPGVEAWTTHLLEPGSSVQFQANEAPRGGPGGRLRVRGSPYLWEERAEQHGWDGRVVPDAARAGQHVVVATDPRPWVVEPPEGGLAGSRLTVRVENGLQGPMGVATWSPVYRMGPWTNPGPGRAIAITFEGDGKAWLEVFRTGELPRARP